jgi:hypothetical protein
MSLKDAELTSSAIDQNVLVGGSTPTGPTHMLAIMGFPLRIGIHLPVL